MGFFWSWPSFDICQYKDQLKWESVFCFTGERISSYIIICLKIRHILKASQIGIFIYILIILGYAYWYTQSHRKMSAIYIKLQFWLGVHIFILVSVKCKKKKFCFSFGFPHLHSLLSAFRSSLTCTHKLPWFYRSLELSTMKAGREILISRISVFQIWRFGNGEESIKDFR